MRKLVSTVVTALALVLLTGTSYAELMANRIETYGNDVFGLAFEIDNHGAIVTGRSVDEEGKAEIDVAAEEVEHQVRALAWLDQVIRDIDAIAVCEHHGPSFDTHEVAEIARAVEAALLAHADRMKETSNVEREEARYAEAIEKLLAPLHEKHKALEREAVIYLCEHGAEVECK